MSNPRETPEESMYTKCVLIDPFNVNDYAQPWADPLDLYLTSENQLRTMSEHQLAGAITELEELNGGYPSDVIASLIYPLLHPSGVWADYNPMVRYYNRLLSLVAQHMISPSAMPPPPHAADYPDVTSPETQWYNCVAEES